MRFLGWLLWSVTVIYGLLGLYFGLRGQSQLTPETWWATVPLGLLGAVLIVMLGWSPWHILWWWALCAFVGAIAMAKRRKKTR